ncbi:MAG: Gfo/Idh/MocA family oxidoreductase [Gammaproteobacteria bacterium]|nr:Gfo/Idh/MocA family oxidoreductase [Gammaproteobacteria bacterium]MBU1557063.1 Gfo/Idh/MocA family oxidoreductase [Gammaproteobacteria bacterium]MBU2069380.1 Gfo/Idh/MocA family oxidoreductase [Gammaproteobacteria bacterium]MBU2184671.1 Gfo/Idh/MocA family oxidoreductase [Gammaproteobacteria bacterium]MBU2206524.1 Gfo/Idh/MocA family oxidoreductase [Gammaproteobacteria bacterium]
MRIALLGLGDIAQKAYLPLIAAMPGITPLLCTRQAAVLQQLMQQYRIKEGYTELGQLIAARPDAVMIHSSTDSHFSLATQLLNAGIAVFIDKPLSYQLAECEQLLALAEQKNQLLFVGFNRRYVPLYQSALAVAPVQLQYQKNRYNLPADTRTFVYDDFIHLLDFAHYACALHNRGNFTPAVYGHFVDGQLGAVQVNWQCGRSLVSASMNRLAGGNFERLEYFASSQHWQVDNLVQGHIWADNRQQQLAVNDWHNTLYKRGFVSMLEDFIQQLAKGGSNTAQNKTLLSSHQLCEFVVQQLQR